MNRINWKFYLIFIPLLFFSCSHQEAQQRTLESISLSTFHYEPAPLSFSAKKLNDLQEKLHKTLKNSGFNGNALVMYKGNKILEYSHGYGDFGQRDKLCPDSPFQMASVSKPFTATAVLMLCNQGKIQLDDSVFHYIPEFPYEDITIRQMLTHTSGLQNYMYLVDQYWDKEKALTNEDVLQLIIKYKLPLNFRPGRRFLYSNTGYAMLALLVERVSGQPYPDWIQENIFNPLGMEHSFAWNKSTYDTISCPVKGYTTSRRWRRNYDFDPLDQVVGDKSIFTTIGDMAQWDRALQQNYLLPDSLANLAYQKTKLRWRTVNYGLGWRLKKYGSREAIYHNGLWNGFTASHTRFPEDDLSIILMSNTKSRVATLVNRLQSQFFKEIEQGD